MVYSQRKHVQILLGNMVRMGHVANIIVWFVNRHKQASLQWLDIVEGIVKVVSTEITLVNLVTK